jgi:hypothetical protein
LANDEAKPSTKKASEEVAVEQNRAQGKKTKIRAEAGANSQQQPNWTIRFSKSDHPVSPGSGQRKTSRTTALRMVPTPHWCPPGLTPSQRRRIQWMRAQKLREEACEKERDEHFNII